MVETLFLDYFQQFANHPLHTSLPDCRMLTAVHIDTLLPVVTHCDFQALLPNFTTQNDLEGKKYEVLCKNNIISLTDI